MSTRSNICILNKEEKTIRKIYCHWDGYPEGVGQVLSDNYKDSNKVNELIDLGDISILDKEVKPNNNLPHNFENPQENVTVAYTRDRGENWDWNKPQIFKIEEFAQFLRNHGDIEYIYLFLGEEKQWIYWDTYKIDRIANMLTDKELLQLAENLKTRLKED